MACASASTSSTRHEKCVHVGTRDGAAARDISGNKRSPTGGRLDQTERQTFAMGRQHGDMGPPPQGRDIFDKPQIAEISLGFPTLDLLRGNGSWICGIRNAGNQEADIAPALYERCMRRNEGTDTLRIRPGGRQKRLRLEVEALEQAPFRSMSTPDPGMSVICFRSIPSASTRASSSRFCTRTAAR